MDATKHLLREVVYLFYPPPAAVVMETLLHHGVLFEDDLVKLCQLHRKVLRSHANSLAKDKLLTVHAQKEESGGRFFTRVYYYIHHIEAIDAIKWKVHCIVKKMKDDIGALSEPQGYVCPTCHRKYTLLDAASLLADDGLSFECALCGDQLQDDDISQEQIKGQEKLQKLMKLLEPIIKWLKEIDDDVIEDNNFESSLIKAIPAFASSLANYSVATINPDQQQQANGKKNGSANGGGANGAGANSYYAPSASMAKPGAGKDAVEAARRGEATIHVSITADDEDLKQERQRKEQRNEKLRQNALPSWHQSSTVGEKQLGKLDGKDKGEFADVSESVQQLLGLKKEEEDDLSIAVEPLVKEEDEYKVEFDDADQKVQPAMGDVNTEEMNALNAYYEQLKKRQESEEQVNEEGEADDDEDWDIEPQWPQQQEPAVKKEESATLDSAGTLDSAVVDVPKTAQTEATNGETDSLLTPATGKRERSSDIEEEHDEFDDLDEDDIDLDMFD